MGARDLESMLRLSMASESLDLLWLSPTKTLECRYWGAGQKCDPGEVGLWDPSELPGFCHMTTKRRPQDKGSPSQGWMLVSAVQLALTWLASGGIHLLKKHHPFLPLPSWGDLRPRGQCCLTHIPTHGDFRDGDNPRSDEANNTRPEPPNLDCSLCQPGAQSSRSPRLCPALLLG